jgi:hypothetical protein
MRASRVVGIVMLVVMAVGLVAVAAGPAMAWARTRVFIGVGPYWGPYPYWWYGPPYYVYSPPPVVVQEPPVYVQQQPAPAAPASPGEWYYCESVKSYYPYVSTCPEAWIKVPARP